jgi:AraC-like DNA-binding protein
MSTIKTGHSNPNLKTSTLWFRYLLDAIQHAGMGSRAIAANCGLKDELLSDPDAFIDDDYTARLLIEAAKLAGDEQFGLTAGQYFTPSAFGPLGYSMMTSATLLDALERTVLFSATVTEGTRAHLTSDGNNRFLEVSMPTYLPDVGRMVDEFMLTCILSAFRWILGRDIKPLSVEFAHAEPQAINRYIQVFGKKPVFSSHRCGFLFSREQLDSPVIFSDESMRKVHDDYARSKTTHPNKAVLSPQIRRIIQQKLHAGEPTLAMISDKLNISERTLQRRLKVEDVSFHGIVDDVRRELLELYLRDSNIALKEITHQLGFADQSSFTRAVHRWYGQSPKAVRLAMADSGKAL